MLDNLSSTYTQATASLHATQSQLSLQAQHAVKSHDAQRRQLFDPMNDTAAELARIQRLLSAPVVSPPDSAVHLQTAVPVRVDQARPRRSSTPVIVAAPLPASSQPSLFDSVDRNHDGVITRAEFSAAFGGAATPPPTKVAIPVVNMQAVPLQPAPMPGPFPPTTPHLAMVPPPTGLRTPPGPPPVVRYVA